MIFQTLDDKKECVGVYYDMEIHKDLPEGLTGTWAYAPYLDGQDIQFANLYCAPDGLSTACPEALKDQWEEISSKLKAFMRSFKEAKVDLNENCFYDLVPKRFLLEFCEIKNKITGHVLNSYAKPDNYEFLLSLQQIIHDIGYQKLNVDLNTMNKKMYDFKTRQIRKKINSAAPYIKYNIFGTKTGRLTTKKHSFPILTLAKEYRSALKPTNDWFVEFDFNAAEIRTFLALSGETQPSSDIHSWNAENIYKAVSRNEAKTKFFAWLYNPESRDRLVEQVYDREKVLKKYWDGKHVTTFYDRIIEADKHHALNYIIQSTASDVFLRRMIAVHEFLKDKKSNIAFSLHDSLIIDFTSDEKKLIPAIKKIFSDTELGLFKVNLSAGKNFGDMKRLKI